MQLKAICDLINRSHQCLDVLRCQADEIVNNVREDIQELQVRYEEGANFDFAQTCSGEEDFGVRSDVEFVDI